MLNPAGFFSLCASAWPTADMRGQHSYSSNGNVDFTMAKAWRSHWKPRRNMLFKLIHGEKADAEWMKWCLSFWGTLIENMLQLQASLLCDREPGWNFKGFCFPLGYKLAWSELWCSWMEKILIRGSSPLVEKQSFLDVEEKLPFQ